MSRSYHQRHRVTRNYKCPRTILDMYIKDGKSIYVWKHIRMKPYGRKSFTGYGGEVYSSKFGEYVRNIVNKKRERRITKVSI